LSSCHKVEVDTPKSEEPPRACSGGTILVDNSTCACPPGKRWNGHVCSAPRETPGGAGHTDNVVTCPSERPVGTFPDCCPLGTRFADGACHRDRTDTGPGHGGADGINPGDASTTKPRVCEGRRPVGVYPNCCPRGTHYLRGACRRDRTDTGPGNGGTNGTNPGKDDTCPRSRPVGKQPHCCPRGTVFRDGMCRHTPRPGTGDGGSTGKCTGGRIGTPPRCVCPSGTHATRSGGCERDAKPSKTTTPTPSKTSGGKCTGGRIGRPPACRCPTGQRLFHGRCRSIPRPKPTNPNGGKVIVK
jgi:hypothetical protein